MSDKQQLDIKADRIPDKGLSIDNGLNSPDQKAIKEQAAKEAINNVKTGVNDPSKDLQPSNPLNKTIPANAVKRGMRYDEATKTLVPDYGEGVKEPNSGRTWEDMQKEKVKTEVESVKAAKVANDLTNRNANDSKPQIVDTAITKENPIETKSPMAFLKK